MGCADSKSAPATTWKLEDYRNIAVEGHNYPPPYIPERNKSEIYDEEVNSSLQARIDKIPTTAERSYLSLLKYLSDGTTKQIHHVTAIYLWMKAQDYQDHALDLEKRPDTPRGYMRLVKDGEGDLTSFFTMLCRNSGISCRIVSGLGKNSDYYLGAAEHDLFTKWCAVYVDDEWRLVHVEWSIPLTRDAKNAEHNSRAPDFFFLTDPEVFTTFCLPENFRWQLLNQAYSKKEFLALPLMRPAFFAMEATIIQPKSGYIRTHNGKTEVEITFPKHVMEEVFVSFLLSYQSGEVSENQGDDVQTPTSLEKYVFMNRKPSRFIFEIYLPVPGKYVFDIYADIEKGTIRKKGHTLERFCQFRIMSDRRFGKDDLEPLPESPEIGWGPGPVCRQLGLVPVSHFDSCMFMKPGDERQLTFKMSKKLDVLCQLTHNYLPIYQLVEQVECSQSNGELAVRVKIPEEGQYALKIYCREAGTNEFHLACVFLIRQRERGRLPENFERGHRRKHRDKMLRTRLEHHLSNHTSEKELEDALKIFNCYNVPDRGERKRAEEKLSHYWLIKRELACATKGRNVHQLKKWVEKARNSRFESDLHDDIQKAEHVDENLGKLNGYAYPIARMDPQTIIEIRNYKRPPKIVHDVMTSTYILLGEPQYELEDWEGIQYQMGKQGKETIQKRMLARSPDDVTVEIADEADDVIQPYDMKKCRAVSNGICTFYRWNKQLINDVKRRDMNEKQLRELASQLSGRETFREPDPSSRVSQTQDGVTFRGRGDHDKETIEHPFAIENQDTNQGVEKTPRKFFMTPLKPTEITQPSAIEYAGWKPQDL